MTRFIILSFVFLGWGFYEMSGGADFVPETRGDAQTAAASPAAAAPAVVEVAAAPETKTDVVTRASGTDLTTVAISVTERAEPAVQPAVQTNAEITLASAEAAPAPRIKAMTAPSPAKIIPARVIDSLSGSDGSATTAATATDVSGDLRVVSGNRVNMRNGPGTDFSVVARLTKGSEVEVLQEPGNGWVKLRVVDTARVGWMADWLITASN